MRLEELELRGRGPWDELSLPPLDGGVNVIFGRNEAGKTSLLAALRGLLHGGPTDLPTANGRLQDRACGGAFRAMTAEGRLNVYRTMVDDQPTGEGAEHDEHVSEAPSQFMIDADGCRVDQHRYDEVWASVDAAIYDNIFSCGLRDLQQLAALEEGEAARMLYDLTAGLDRISLAEVLRDVRARRDELMNADGGASKLASMLDEHRQLTREIDRLSDATEEYNRRLNEQDSLTAQITEIEAEQSTVEHRVALLRAAESVQNAWTEQTRLRNEVDALDEYRTIPVDGPRRLKTATAKIAKLAGRMRTLRAKRRELLAEFKELPDAGKLARRAPEIEALSEQGEFIAAMEKQAEEQQAAIRDLKRQQESTLEEAGLSHETWLALSSSFDRKSFDKLRPLVKGLESDRAAVDAAREESTEAKRLATEAARKSARGGPSEAERQQLRKEAKQDVAQLKRRVELDEKLEQLQDEATELEEASTDLAKQQGLTTGQLILLVCVGVVGVALVLGTALGVLGGSWWPVLPGLVLIGAAYGGKLFFEKRNALLLEEMEGELESLHEQIEQSAKQRETFDRELPKGGGSIEERLAEAEGTLRDFSQAENLEASREEREHAAEDAEARLQESQDQLARRKDSWKKALATFGLPEQLSPKQVGKLRNHWDQSKEIAERLDRAESRYRQGESSRENLRQRIHDLADDLEIELSEENANAQLANLRRELERQRGSLRRRTALKAKLRKLNRGRKKLKSSLSLWRRRRRSILTSAGAADEADLARRCEEAGRRAEMLTRLSELKERIDSSLAQVSRDEVLARLREFGITGVAAELNELELKADRLHGELQAMYDRRGWLSQKLPEMLEDRSLPTALFQREMVEQQIRKHLNEWRVLATVHFLLKRIRDRYERERQPETLRDATRYFQKITEGAYRRVWTPLDEDVLYVENERGETLTPDQLSGGTREQLFLCLRLAVVSSHAQRGARLPVVLDDVLVNFDAPRARAAAAVLAEFAADGHQVFVFTCHEHIARLFAELKLRVIRMSRYVNKGRDRSLIDEIIGGLTSRPAEVAPRELPVLPSPVVEESEPPLAILDEAPAPPEPEAPLADEPIITGFIVDPTPTRHTFDAEEFEGELEDDVFPPAADEAIDADKDIQQGEFPRDSFPQDKAA